MTGAAPVAGELAPTDVVLSVQNLTVTYASPRGQVQAVRDVSFFLRRGESLALIGESGSGKTTLGLSIVRLLPRSARVVSGRILYVKDGREIDVLRLDPAALRRFRWQECAMVFQSALNAFNPVLRIWQQVLDTARAHGLHDARLVREKAAELLRMVQLEPERVLSAYPHQLSGGMRQRVLLALSLLLDPQVLILDEPTTALDILTQRALIDLLRELQARLKFAMLFISHDLSLAAELADRVATMYGGTLVEVGDVRQIFYEPRHPYTLGLIRAVPTVTGDFRQIASIAGTPPDLVHLPPGCKFHPRCPYAEARCREQEPRLEPADGGQVACFLWRRVREDAIAARLQAKAQAAPEPAAESGRGDVA